MLLEIDGTFLIAGLSFIIFVIIMNIILYKPMVRILGEREDFYNQNSATLKGAKDKTQAIVEDNNLKITISQKEASELVKNASQSAKEKKAKTLHGAQKACEHRVKDINEKLHTQTRHVKKELHADVANFVREISSKVLGKEVAHVEIEPHKIDKLLGDAHV